jgi:hypothetical protein
MDTTHVRSLFPHQERTSSQPGKIRCEIVIQKEQEEITMNSIEEQEREDAQIRKERKSVPEGYGRYRGRLEYNPGKMRFREKGTFKTEKGAREEQGRLKAQGLKTKVVYYPGSLYPWSLQVMAKHDFWNKNYIYKR